MSYGYCPKCGAPGKSRERRPNGYDRCENGCVYPSRDSLNKPPEPCKECERLREVLKDAREHAARFGLSALVRKLDKALQPTPCIEN